MIAFLSFLSQQQYGYTFIGIWCYYPVDRANFCNILSNQLALAII